jgi:hypothetical protein
MTKEENIKDIVNTFFRDYTRQVTLSETGKTPEQLEPRMLKQAMLEHYEEVAAAFHSAVFQKIAAANGLSLSTVPDDITPEMMRTICVTESLFNTMVEAYRQNFFALLQGKTI